MVAGMSLAIDVAQVRSVLLVDGWHAVADGSFTIDAYEYVAWDAPGIENPVSLAAGDSGLCDAGFAFDTDDGERIAGPLTSVLAVDRAS